MNITNKNYKTYRMLALVFVVVLSLGVTMIAMAQASPGGGDKAVGQDSNQLIEPQGLLTECMVDRFNATHPGGEKESLECTSNDVQLAAYVLNAEPEYCIEGEIVTVQLMGQFRATSAERWDVGVFISTDGGNPNTLGGVCYNDFLHPVSLTNLDLDLGGGYGPFYNGEIEEDPADSCGDTQQYNGTNASFLVTDEIQIVCQDTDNDNIADVNSCTVWSNAKSDGSANKPSCIDELDTGAETTAKCTCGPIPIVGLVVPETGTIEVIKDLIPTTDSGLFNLLIDDIAEASNVGDGGTTGAVTVSAGTDVDPGDDHTVSETAGTATVLADYDTAISCTSDQAHSASATGAGPLTLTVLPDEDWVCTITNTLLKTTPSITTALHQGATDSGAPVVVAVGGSVPLGTSMHDSATVTNGSFAFTGTVTFEFFKNLTCAGTAEASSTGVALVNGVADPALAQTNLAVGDYAYHAKYIAGSDPYHYDSAWSSCEYFSVSKAQFDVTHCGARCRPRSTMTNLSVPLGSIMHDTAAVTGGVGGL